MMKIISVVGARPQFIKSAPVSWAIREAGHQEFQIHTGQHYDYGLSRIFFDELDLAEPAVNLGIGSGTHAYQTGKMLIRIEQILLEQKPDVVLVYGDTNSTLAGALAAAKLNIRLAHVEAGLRSYNRKMPEEHNRVLTDHCSDLLFCPTETAINNLHREGIHIGVHLVGDTMYDAVLQFGPIAEQRSKILHTLQVKSGNYLLCTIHRAYNTDSPGNLRAILEAFRQVPDTIVFPIHPRTAEVLKAENMPLPNNVKAIDPVGYLDMLMLEKHARLILTDSGGMQKEAYFFQVPCLTLRTETEWVETLESGWNKVVGVDTDTIVMVVCSYQQSDKANLRLFGDGQAANNIIHTLENLNYNDNRAA